MCSHTDRKIEFKNSIFFNIIGFMETKRFIETKSVQNIRDLGGLKNKDGKEIRKALLLRSGSLNKINGKDMEYLKRNFNLRMIIDLRTDEEVREKPDIRIDGVKYMHIPLLDSSELGMSREEKLHLKDYVDKLPNMEKLYENLVTNESSVSKLKEAIKTIVNNRDGAVLWHCSAGKDRCGLVAAILLELLDVDIDTIIEDYMLSNVAAEKVAKKYHFLTKLTTGDEEIAKKVYEIFVCKRSYLDVALRKMEEKSGSVKDYVINELGISNAEIRNFNEYVYDIL